MRLYVHWLINTAIAVIIATVNTPSAHPLHVPIWAGLFGIFMICLCLGDVIRLLAEIRDKL